MHAKITLTIDLPPYFFKSSDGNGHWELKVFVGEKTLAIHSLWGGFP